MIKWLVILLGSAVSLGVLWFSSIPLGIPGEWVWQRVKIQPDFAFNILGGAIAAALYIGYVEYIRDRWDDPARPVPSLESAGCLAGLFVVAFAWLWVVQEVAPVEARLGKSAFVLYYPSSSGYFTRARYEQPNTAQLLSTYEDLMRQGDVLHTGTHPPGLFLVFRGLITFCEAYPGFANLLDSFQPWSFRAASDVITRNVPLSATSRSFVPTDRSVIWLATLLVMAAASLVVVPLFFLISRYRSPSTAWFCASFWPAIPAVAIFVPKSDVAFSFIGVMVVWLWLAAWERRSLMISVFAGLVAWCGLICSLAFLPVFLATALMTLGAACIFRRDDGASSNDSVESVVAPAIGAKRWLCIASAGVGFLVPTAMLWWTAHVNMLNVWLMNYRNHANFYRQYTRTYWKWLFVNPIELSYAVGWPLAFGALVASVSLLTVLLGKRKRILPVNVFASALAVLFVWSLLWLTGKNSGEAARLWIIFMPWLIWLFSLCDVALGISDKEPQIRRTTSICLLIVQFMVCLLTVTRVTGFHFE